MNINTSVPAPYKISSPFTLGNGIPEQIAAKRVPKIDNLEESFRNWEAGATMVKDGKPVSHMSSKSFVISPTSSGSH